MGELLSSHKQGNDEACCCMAIRTGQVILKTCNGPNSYRSRDKGKRQSWWRVTGKLESMEPELGVALRYVKYYMSRDKIDVVREQAMCALCRSTLINIPLGHERDEPLLLLNIREFCGHGSNVLRRPMMPEPERIDHRAHVKDWSRSLGRGSYVHR